MESQSKSEQIKRNREDMRKNIKSKLKLPIIGRDKVITNPMTPKPAQAQESPDKPKLEKRLFDKEYEMLSKIGELLGYLGQGAHGVVYKCREIKSGRIYAVKVLSGDSEVIRITKRTYAILKFFDDPRILKGRCLFIDETREQIYLVMEYCEYPSLKSILREGKIPYDQCKTIIRKLLETVQLINSKSVCHRDLKPDNILYDREKEQIKLIDFGVSKILVNRKTKTKQKMWTVTGTIHYKAPEMFEGTRHDYVGMAYDELVDSWAIGVTAYEMLYGKLPFESQYVQELIDKIVSEQPEYPELHDIQQSKLTTSFLKALLKKNPQNRLSSTDALNNPWIGSSVSRKRIPSEEFSTSMLITPSRQVQKQGLFTASPPQILQQSSIVEEKKNNGERRQLSWSQIEGDIHEVHKENNEDSWTFALNITQNLRNSLSKEEIEAAQETVSKKNSSSMESFEVFQGRAREHSITEQI